MVRLLAVAGHLGPESAQGAGPGHARRGSAGRIRAIPSSSTSTTKRPGSAPLVKRLKRPSFRVPRGSISPIGFEYRSRVEAIRDRMGVPRRSPRASLNQPGSANDSEWRVPAVSSPAVLVSHRRSAVSGDQLDHQRARAARNQSLFREVNRRIEELAEKFQAREESFTCVCECADQTCLERIEVSHDEYARVRRHANEFIVKPGHEIPQVEEVVHRETRWIVVRKLGVGAEIAAELDGAAPDD